MPPPPPSSSSSSASAIHLLLTSLGNPPPLHTTRHSAGHILLQSLAQHLHCPPFVRSRPHGSGLVTQTSALSSPRLSLTLWQSPTQMNVSGPAVLAAWRAFVRHHTSVPTTTGDGTAESGAGVALGLVILHDELEARPGTLRVRRGLAGSVKGHNGLKSVMGSLRGTGLEEGKGKRPVVVRVGVGIGRPGGGGRERGEVSDYVLGNCTVAERRGIEGLVGELEGVLAGF